MEVKRWFKQLRRLQSLANALKAAKPTPAALSYRLELWRAIKDAPGFASGFVRWWPCRHVQLQGLPALLPDHLPTPAMANTLREDFRANFRRLEAWHIRRRQEVLQAKYSASRDAMLKALRTPSPPQVDTLQVQRSYTVVATDPSTQQFHIHPPLDVRGSSIWMVQDARVAISPVDDHTCTIVGPLDVYEGDELEQVQTLSSVLDVQQEFVSMWKVRWQRHANITPSDWQRVFAFSSAFLPRLPLILGDITLEQWRAAVRRFKPRAARGPDGYAKQDLVGLSDGQTHDLLGALHAIENGREWPKQWLTGLVLSLDKQNGRTDAQAYRPIVLYSIVYRTWSGLRSRQLLAHLAQLSQYSAYGFLPGREAAEFWACLQADIEGACQSGSAMCGLSTDLVKAFNGLPRLPIFHMAGVIGLPDRVCRPWSSFLESMERRFVVRNCVSTPLRSNVGFPEGCPLSPTAMALTDIAWHCYLSAFEPRVRSHSFVDNLSLTAEQIPHLAQGWNCTQVFCEMLHLELDDDKTYAWALQVSMRKELRSLRLPVKLLANDLGGHMAYCHSTRTIDLHLRCASLEPVWKAMARLRGPALFKLSLLPAKCWPKALHGTLGCLGGASELQRLRTAATKALKLCPAGSSAQLRLSLCPVPMADPELFLIQRAFLDFRRICHKQLDMLDKWRLFHARFSGTFFQGPFSRLARSFETLGWSLLQPPKFHDSEGLEFDLLSMPHGLLARILRRDWLGHVAHNHRHRLTMRDLHGIEPALASLDGHKLSALDSSRLAAVQSGAFLCPASHAKFDRSQSGLCRRCHVIDDVRHRLCECPLYAQAREPVQWAVGLFDILPDCLTHHLLVPACPDLQQLRAVLHALPDEPVYSRVLVKKDEMQHLFTDGSCFFADTADLALAS